MQQLERKHSRLILHSRRTKSSDKRIKITFPLLSRFVKYLQHSCQCTSSKMNLFTCSFKL